MEANDYFEVFGNKQAWKQFEVQVFNRIGEKVYESNDMNFKWDGTYKGVLINPTVLVYTCKSCLPE
jgi:gliding motility-associated-like protein